MQDCLANTGSSIISPAIIVVFLIGAALAILKADKRLRSMVVTTIISIGGMLLVYTGSAAYAAPVTTCPAHGSASQPDTTTGAQGSVQSTNVGLNDTPSNGAQFLLSSLILILPPNPLAGSTVSPDQKTITVPGEGVYIAGTSGIITFTPEPSFSGTTHGIIYSLKDTLGETVKNTYTPTVTATVVACADPASETRILDPITINEVYGISDNTIDNFIANSTNSPAIDPSAVDLDPTISGIQQTISHPSEGWSAVYNPATDQLTVSVTDWAIFYGVTGAGPLFSYTIAPVPNCTQPAGGNVNVFVIS